MATYSTLYRPGMTRKFRVFSHDFNFSKQAETECTGEIPYRAQFAGMLSNPEHPSTARFLFIEEMLTEEEALLELEQIDMFERRMELHATFAEGHEKTVDELSSAELREANTAFIQMIQLEQAMQQQGVPYPTRVVEHDPGSFGDDFEEVLEAAARAEEDAERPDNISDFSTIADAAGEQEPLDDDPDYPSGEEG